MRQDGEGEYLEPSQSARLAGRVGRGPARPGTMSAARAFERFLVHSAACWMRMATEVAHEVYALVPPPADPASRTEASSDCWFAFERMEGRRRGNALRSFARMTRGSSAEILSILPR